MHVWVYINFQLKKGGDMKYKYLKHEGNLSKKCKKLGKSGGVGVGVGDTNE